MRKSIITYKTVTVIVTVFVFWDENDFTTFAGTQHDNSVFK
jgi:hypothetical protein